VGERSVYMALSSMGTGTPISSNARRWRGVGAESWVVRAPPAKAKVLRVRLASSSSKVAKLWRGWPSRLALREALERASGERRAGATGPCEIAALRR